MKPNHYTMIAASLVIIAIAIVALFGRQLGVPKDASAHALAFLGALGTLALGAMRSFFDGNQEMLP